MFSVVTPKWREPTRVIRMVQSMISEVSGPSITRRGHLSRRPHRGQQVINRTRARAPRRPAGSRDGRSAETPANLVPHFFPELFPARRPFLFVDIEAIENVEIFQDRMTIACHRQNAKLFSRRPAGASDLPFADRVGAGAGREAPQLRHFSRRQASANGVTEILPEMR